MLLANAPVLDGRARIILLAVVCGFLGQHSRHSYTACHHNEEMEHLMYEEEAPDEVELAHSTDVLWTD